MTEKLFLTVTEVADMLSLSKRQVYELAAAGRLGPKKFIGPRNFRLQVDAVRNYAEHLPEEAKSA